MLRQIIARLQEPTNDALLGIDDERRFRETLERERLRSERNGSIFTLVLFDVTDPAKLVPVLKERLRTIDVPGWFDGQVAALLPETGVEGARIVADDVCRTLELDLDNEGFTVFVFPEIPSAHEPAAEDGISADDEAAPVDDEAPRTVAENAETPPETEDIASLNALFVRPLPLWKRALDFCGAAIGLVLLSPVLLTTAIAIRWTSPGPALFKQRRHGLGGKPFSIYKFRTMYIDAEERKAELLALSEQDGPAFKLKDDPRITPIGAFLRKSCIDELPQLWNVLRGEMSLVGPRPLPCNEAEQCQTWEKRRLSVTPGLTCIWQVDGGSHVPFADWMRMDIRYIRRRNLKFDLRLLWKTFVEVLFHRASH